MLSHQFAKSNKLILWECPFHVVQWFIDPLDVAINIPNVRVYAVDRSVAVVAGHSQGNSSQSTPIALLLQKIERTISGDVDAYASFSRIGLHMTEDYIEWVPGLSTSYSALTTPHRTSKAQGGLTNIPHVATSTTASPYSICRTTFGSAYYSPVSKLHIN